MYEKYREKYHCVFQTELYTKEQWLEIMPLEASKSHAIAQLKKQLGCERLVVFGDGKNDMDMFELADEAYAVENAVPELKAIATAVIGSNDSDGVARWLAEHWQGKNNREIFAATKILNIRKLKLHNPDLTEFSNK